MQTEKEKDSKIKAAVLAEYTDSELKGDPELLIDSARGINESKKFSATFADSREFLSKALNSAASLIITKKGLLDELELESFEKTFLLSDNPRRVFAQTAQLLTDRPYFTANISAEAVIADSAELGKNLSIHPGVIISENAEIGDNTILAPGVIIGPDVKIGNDCLFHPGVIIERESEIADQVIIQSGAVIGSDGFGYASDKRGHHKIPQQGNVVIESEVEIGANTTIDRGASGSTVIKKGAKLDNLVMIAHNVEVGEQSMLVGQVGIAGSTTLEKRVTLGGQAGVVGHINLAENTTGAARAMITSKTNQGDFISGAPAHDHKDALKEQAYLRRLPKYIKKIKQLEKRIAELEDK
ncbi:UDP-3-O-(3-hydroxymyristoyl)glucosamine N-acyltransferase [Halanaerobium hydrogeniformans]|uniref:UDP-3-O-acylglucosamine N-acyltransferase n=1 Tax=Halanaerobium hydrogeniformans TaxID=656519 RepID=E4RP68_HALHG|nr:UDP-3-O-(3-hydroxymyristoyl)glucosamine N-acyltransferase [Halanaerobium hydrogeniformans]ADQ13893.1 UDP-3-O-(3-hydroxymyristoyl) glucosamine N-acyltransferase [Halanaerobium hydrogeniformans]